MDRIVPLANTLIIVLWIVWLVVWTAAAFFVKRTRRREALGPTLVERLPVLAGAWMLALAHWLPDVLTRRFLSEGPALALGALVLVAAGLAVAYWARIHLGRNWSGEVMVKEGHSLITSGPYRWVRHPIYSGIILALIGSALATGAPNGLIGLALISFSFLVRVRLEEALMHQTFPDTYDAYRRRTARLIPGVY